MYVLSQNFCITFLEKTIFRKETIMLVGKNTCKHFYNSAN